MCQHPVGRSYQELDHDPATLDEALVGVDACIDVTSFEASDRESTKSYFGRLTRNLLDAELKAGVKHHVLLSILNLDLIEGNAHHAGKHVQEELVSSSPVPHSILRAAQFHEFAEMLVRWVRTPEGAGVPPILIQPVAVIDVAEVLAEIAVDAPRGLVNLAGPKPEDLVDMARRTFAVLNEPIELHASWRGSVYGVEAAGEKLLPGPDARLASTTFEDWLKLRASQEVSKAAG
jgi:uncharacterized protein YbjT (DUF2867 family)